MAVDCYARASAPAEPVDDVVGTLRGYDSEGLVDEFAVETWPDEVRLTDAAEGSSVLDRYERFRAWADDGGVSLEPAFARRDRTTVASDGSETVLVLPVLCLAVRTEGELVSVAPHTAGTTTYTVGDALADVGSRSVPSRTEAPDHPVRPASRSSPSGESPTRETDENVW